MAKKTPVKFIFDFQKLVKTFSEICPDFIYEPNYANATMSRRFAEQVIFEYSKQAKVAKCQAKNKVWKMKLEAEGMLENIVTITMYTTKESPPPQQPVVLNGNLELTFKQASLLAVAKYCQIVPHLVLRDEIVLTPLAGAVFAIEDMPALAKALGEPLPQLLMSVISSCQTDGYYLEHSRCYIAIVAITKTVTDLQMQASIVKKNIKMYKLYGKDFDMTKFQICNKFVHSKRATCQPNNIEVDQLVSQIMTYNMKNTSDQPSHSLKHIMKCAARFDGPAKKIPYQK